MPSIDTSSIISDKLLRSFVTGGAGTNGSFNMFNDIQDPTFMSFKLDFFPDGGYSYPEDTYSSGGLFRPPNLATTLDNYSFMDSAADYLARIGAPAAQANLEIFIEMLYKLQNEAPWYFQTVTGLSDMYRIDPAYNYRGKDKILTIDCLETIDMRMSLLADAYRNAAFDPETMREILPINLRTFNMAIYVLEFRKFNTTYGKIADFFRGGATASNLNSADLDSAYEAISVQTFILKDCEFDFFSEAPSYLDSVSVKDTTEATFKFKIKARKIKKTGIYSLWNYIISEYAKESAYSTQNIKSSLPGRNFSPSTSYFEQLDFNPLGDLSFFGEYAQAVYPIDSTIAKSFATKKSNEAALKATNINKANPPVVSHINQPLNLSRIANELGIPQRVLANNSVNVLNAFLANQPQNTI